METEEIANDINILETIKETINTLLNSLFDSLHSNIFPLLDDITFIDNSIIENDNFEKIFGTSINNGILILANCFLTGFVLYYCIRLMISHFSGNNIESPYKFFIKAIISAILMNFSLNICSYIIQNICSISTFFTELGYSIFNKPISFVTFSNELKSTLNQSLDVFSIDGLLSSTLLISAFTLTINFSLRYIIIKVLIIISPFMFLCLINKTTEHFFKGWLKSFITLNLLQVFVAIILLLPFSIMKEDPNSLFNKLLLLGTISALLKSNEFVKELFGGLGINANINTGLSGIKSIIR